MSVDDSGIHRARKSYSLCISWPSLTPVNLRPRGVNRSLNIQCLRHRGSCVIERRLRYFCLQNETAAARGKRVMQAMSLNFALAQKGNTSFTPCKDQIEGPSPNLSNQGV